jgi:hypothetical protein
MNAGLGLATVIRTAMDAFRGTDDLSTPTAWLGCSTIRRTSQPEMSSDIHAIIRLVATQSIWFAELRWIIFVMFKSGAVTATHERPTVHRGILTTQQTP